MSANFEAELLAAGRAVLEGLPEDLLVVSDPVPRALHRSKAPVGLSLVPRPCGILNQMLVPKIGGGRVAAFEVLVGTPAVRT